MVIGATPEGRKELIGSQMGFRESAQSWRDLLADLKERGLAEAPQLAILDGALGFWKALDQVFPSTGRQRCWVHKTANVLGKLPKSLQRNEKQELREVWLSPDRARAKAALKRFRAKYGAKYPAAVTCLMEDRAELLAFYAVPAEHWRHVRTTSPHRDN